MSQPAAPRHVVLITGASSGIGRAVAHRLAPDGHRLVLVSRSADVLDEVAAECRERGAADRELLVCVADVRDQAAVTAAFEAAVQRFGGVDRVVHCAGALAYGRFEDVPAEVFDGALDTTLGGTTHVLRQALRRFRAQGQGHMIVIGSVLGKMTTPWMSSYTTAKWGMHGLLRTVQVELRDSPGIDVSLISPAGVDTPIYEQAGTYLGRHGRPPPPVASPEKLAEVVAATLDRPRREVVTGRIHHLFALAFRLLPGPYDALVRPMAERVALSDSGGVPPTPGNVLHPLPDGEAVRGDPDRRRAGPARAASDPPTTTPTEGGTMTDERQARQQHRRDPGPTLSRQVEAPASAVWEVLSDGWSYATWVVGASRVRDVDAGWPAEGTRVHHSFGVWPAVIQDFTRVERSTPPTDLVLTARGWPVGEARVHISVSEDGPARSVVTISEDATTGPGKLIPGPVRHAILVPRNKETLHRLALLAEGRYRETLRNG